MDSSFQSNENTRLEILNRYEVLDTDAEQLFDDFTHLASHICETPISLISLVDEKRQWFKAKVGLDVAETPRELAFCAHAIQNPTEILVVENALEDERFLNNPLVTGEPHIRSYAGAPLITIEGYTLGTLCVIDQKPRQLNKEQLAALKMLARQVVSQLDARVNLRQLHDAATELEKERRETQLILDSVPAFVFFKDTKNNILRANRPVTESLGLDRSEVEGKHTAEIYPDLADEYYKDDLEVIQSKQPKLGIIEQLDTDQDGLHWIRTDKIPVPNDRGEVERLLVLALDITDLKKTEDSLRKSQSQLGEMNAHLEELVSQKTAELSASQALYEDLYENSPDMHVSVNPEDASVIRCNQTLLTATGYSLEEVVGQPVFKLYHTSSLDKANQSMEEFRTTGAVKNRELILACKDGSPIDVSLNVGSLRDEQGNILVSRSVWRDITEQKRLVKEVEKSANQLAHLARVATMNEMATGIAHEINQPLHAIKNYAQGALIRLNKQAIEEEAIASLFGDIVLEADRAAQLIQSFRRFIKPSEKHSIRISPKELAKRLSLLISREATQLSEKLTIRIAEDLPLFSCDSVQLKQVLLNLILNARDAMESLAPSDQVIQLIIEHSENNKIRFSVIDRGHGLRGANPERFFDAFYTTKESGLGMGLAICRTIVEAHGGELLVQENEGPGLTMSFELQGHLK